MYTAGIPLSICVCNFKYFSRCRMQNGRSYMFYSCFRRVLTHFYAAFPTKLSWSICLILDDRAFCRRVLCLFCRRFPIFYFIYILFGFIYLCIHFLFFFGGVPFLCRNLFPSSSRNLVSSCLQKSVLVPINIYGMSLKNCTVSSIGRAGAGGGFYFAGPPFGPRSSTQQLQVTISFSEVSGKLSSNNMSTCPTAVVLVLMQSFFCFIDQFRSLMFCGCLSCLFVCLSIYIYVSAYVMVLVFLIDVTECCSYVYPSLTGYLLRTLLFFFFHFHSCFHFYSLFLFVGFFSFSFRVRFFQILTDLSRILKLNGRLPRFIYW